MTTPSWLANTLAAVMLAAAAYCAARLIVARLWHRRIEADIDAVHLVMAVAMAGMLVNRLSFLDHTAWEVVFALTSLWFAVRAFLAWRTDAANRRLPGHHLGHLVLSGSMLYMYLAQRSISDGSSTGGMAGMAGMAGGMTGSGAHYPTLALVLALVLFGYAVSVLDRTTALPAFTLRRTGPHEPEPVPSASAGQQPLKQALLAPRSANCCDVVMSVTMAYLLIILL